MKSQLTEGIVSLQLLRLSLLQKKRSNVSYIDFPILYSNRVHVETWSFIQVISRAKIHSLKDLRAFFRNYGCQTRRGLTSFSLIVRILLLKPPCQVIAFRLNNN